MSLKVMVAIGTRPEAIKMCPLIKELGHREGTAVRVCVSGQHKEMLEGVLRDFGVVADHDLEIMKSAQTLTHITTGILERIGAVLERECPDIVLVHGDTTTAFAVSLACFYARIPVAHVEAGLRTGDIFHPFPEEFNRRAVALTARMHFAPTEGAKKNLVSEGVDESRVFVTGNTVVDAIRLTVREKYSHPLLERTGKKKIIFLTAHRRESIGKPLCDMLAAVRRIAELFGCVRIIYPVHPNPVVRETATRLLGGCERVRICEPLGVADCHNIMARSYLILTDSGGIQEEAAALGKPVLIMRDVTERPEGISAGVARLVGTDTENIISATRHLLLDREEYRKMRGAVNPYGDGHACERIADILLSETKKSAEWMLA